MLPRLLCAFDEAGLESQRLLVLGRCFVELALGHQARCPDCGTSRRCRAAAQESCDKPRPPRPAARHDVRAVPGQREHPTRLALRASDLRSSSGLVLVGCRVIDAGNSRTHNWRSAHREETPGQVYRNPHQARAAERRPCPNTFSLSIRERRPAGRSSSTTTAGRWPRPSRSSRRSCPRPGDVEHDPEAIWSSQLAVAAQALAQAGLEAARHRRHRRDQPARDDDPLGTADAAGRWPTPSSGKAASAPGICERLKADGLEATFRERDRPGRRRLFLRHQDQAPARHDRRLARPGPSTAKSSSAPSTPGCSGG